MQKSSDENVFVILSNEEREQLDHAYSKYISITRPHRHPLLGLDEQLLTEHLSKTKLDLAQLTDGEGLREIEQYAVDVIGAASAKAAKSVLPALIENLVGRVTLSEANRKARVGISRLMYIHAARLVLTTEDQSHWKHVHSPFWTSQKNLILAWK